MAGVMFQRPSPGLVLYLVAMAGLSLAVIGLVEMMARQAFASLAVMQSDEGSASSRVEVGLEAHARSAEWQPTSYVVEIRAVAPPQLSAGALARGMDYAERLPLPPPPGHAMPSGKRHPVVKARVAVRVAGWVKRMKPAPKTMTARKEIQETKGNYDETPARIIERSLMAGL